MYLWDSNILRHFAENHPTLLANIRRTGQTQIALPSIVVAEVLRGRSEYALKATPAQAPQAHQLLIETIALLQRFRVVPFDQQCAKVMVEIQQRSKTKKRYADVLIAATAIAKQMVVVTRNEKDFVDLLPAKQVVNWIDD
ncbi:MAG: type II toxin-antitoxin system VapC family toxin [Caldilinea sp. CFX5]|nr:type II toxin-antitoxin system VapC family toxin [Caldilinea sp. CFX5]